MPTYTLKDIETGEEHQEFFTSWSKLDEYLAENTNYITVIRQAPAIVSGHGIGLKVADGFNDLLKGIKKGSGKANTIQTK